MKGSEIGSAAFREPPSGGPRKAQPEVCLESRSPQQSVGLRGKSLIFRLKVTRVRRPQEVDLTASVSISQPLPARRLLVRFQPSRLGGLVLRDAPFRTGRLLGAACDASV